LLSGRGQAAGRARERGGGGVRAAPLPAGADHRADRGRHRARRSRGGANQLEVHGQALVGTRRLAGSEDHAMTSRPGPFGTRSSGWFRLVVAAALGGAGGGSSTAADEPAGGGGVIDAAPESPLDVAPEPPDPPYSLTPFDRAHVGSDSSKADFQNV